jgi:hypothetical protein
VASIVGTPPSGKRAPVPVESNAVVVKVAPAAAPAPGPGPGPTGGVEGEKAKCAAFAGTVVLKGAAGPKRHKFTVKVSARGIKTITFYLDGRKVKTLNAPAHGKDFSIKINPRKLKSGSHKISATAVLASPACGTLKLARIFIHPRRGIPRFTG